MPAFQKHTKTIQRAPVPMADVCAELALPPDAEVRDLCCALLVRAFDFPADTHVELGVNEVVFTWEGGEKSAKNGSKKKEPTAPTTEGDAKKAEPAPAEAKAPAPVNVDWKGALDATRPTALDLKKAEEEAGTEKVAAVRQKLNIGPTLEVRMIALQSNGPIYYGELRAPAAAPAASAPAGAK